MVVVVVVQWISVWAEMRWREAMLRRRRERRP
jgi:hypothetical protein